MLAKFTTAAAVFTAITAFAAADPAQYESDLSAFFEHVDETYPFFDLKNNAEHWESTKANLREKVTNCETDKAFLALIVDAIGALRDSHIYLSETDVALPERPRRFNPGVSFMPGANETVLVMGARNELAAALPVGTLVTRINGEIARGLLERSAVEMWEAGFIPSPQRARLFAYRMPLQGDRGETHTITIARRATEHIIELTSDIEVRGWPHTYNMPEGLQRVGRSFWYTKLRENVGYMHLRRIDASIVEGMDAATAAHPAVRGWVVDLRGNGGGGYGEDLIERIRSLARPVAVIIDAGCASAGETVARDFRRYADAKLYGTRTAGSSSSKHQWSFPSGIATVRLPSRSRWRVDRKPIEFNGIEPDIVVEPTAEDVQSGRNTEIERAIEGILSVKSMPIRRPN